MVSVIKGILWIASAILSFFIAAMTVSPQEAVANIMKWLSLLGLRSASGWFSEHASHKVHLSPDSIMHAMTAKCAKPPCAEAMSSSSSYEVPEIVLFALAALVVALIFIWFMRRRPESMLASRGW